VTDDRAFPESLQTAKQARLSVVSLFFRQKYVQTSLEFQSTQQDIAFIYKYGFLGIYTN
jgi:hypothetical protein